MVKAQQGQCPVMSVLWFTDGTFALCPHVAEGVRGSLS